MFISSKHRRSGDTSRSSLSLPGGIIPLVRTTAHLGVRISSTLSWSDHVSNHSTSQVQSFFCWNAWLVVTDLLTLLSGCTVVLSVLCSSMLRLFGMHMLPTWNHCHGALPAVDSKSYFACPPSSDAQRRCAGHHRLAYSGLASPSPKTVFAVWPSARRWSSLSARPSSFACVSSLLWLFPQSCLILCLSLLFVAPPSAHFCKLLISFFFLISFLTVCHRSQLFSHTFFP